MIRQPRTGAERRRRWERTVARERRRWDRKVKWGRFWTTLRIKIGWY